MDSVETMKKLLREDAAPYFSDEEIKFYLDKNNGDMNAALYECFCIKAEDTTLSISGLNLSDTSAYFKRLARMYKPRHSGILKG